MMNKDTMFFAAIMLGDTMIVFGSLLTGGTLVLLVNDIFTGLQAAISLILGVVTLALGAGVLTGNGIDIGKTLVKE